MAISGAGIDHEAHRLPFTWPSVMKGRPIREIETASRAAVPAADSKCWPISSDCRLPSTSSTAEVLSTDTSTTPSAVFCPTGSVRGAPRLMVTTALPGKRPTTVTSVAAARAGTSRNASEIRCRTMERTRS